MAINRVYKFSDIVLMQAFLNGTLIGSQVSGIPQGWPGLVGTTLTFVSPGPAGSVTFVASTNPNNVDPYMLQFRDIKAQVEAAVAGILVFSIAGRIAFSEATPTNGVSLAGGSTGGHAMAVGTVDLNTLSYGAGGTLDTKTFILNVDGTGDHTVTFAAPANRAAVVSQINAVLLTAGTASIDGNNHLVVTSPTTGGTSTVLVKAGTANADLGFTNNTTFTGASTNQANSLLGFDSAGAVAKKYVPPGVSGGPPQWAWIESTNENMHMVATWE